MSFYCPFVCVIDRSTKTMREFEKKKKTKEKKREKEIINGRYSPESVDLRAQFSDNGRVVNVAQFRRQKILQRPIGFGNLFRQLAQSLPFAVEQRQRVFGCHQHGHQTQHGHQHTAHHRSYELNTRTRELIVALSITAKRNNQSNRLYSLVYLSLI